MKKIFGTFKELLVGDKKSDQVVPPSGITVTLTLFAAAAAAFLSVFALSLSLAADRLADEWANELARTSTIRISAPENQIAQQTDNVLNILSETPGISNARLMTDEEQRKLLEPWFGPGVPVESLPIPRLVEITEDDIGPDMAGLRLRLSAEAPGAVLDDHTRWRKPLITAAWRLRVLGVVSIVLITSLMLAMVILAAQSALAANTQVIGVLRLVGAKDSYIVRAFVRRFTVRCLIGAAVGTVLALVGVMLLPGSADEGAFLTGLGFQGWHWMLPILIPLISALVAFLATRFAALKTLERLA